MDKKLNETVGSMEYDNLIYGTSPATDVFSVVVRKGSGAQSLKRGTVLALSGGTAGDGKMVVLGTTAAQNETLTANCILADDAEVGTSADETVVAYRTGHFNRGALIAKTGYTITKTDEEDLRKGGILLSTAL